MKEALFILLIVLGLLAFTAVRYRRQIAAAIHFWRLIKGARTGIKEGNTSLPKNQDEQGRLVNCSKCGRWTSENEAIRLGKVTFFCSTSCLENRQVVQ
ncbi:MAG: hypothetical protein LC730_06335 [Acidobacteria bacterium]|nr:hypothetical protein [Acidobacteriota bacterium]MCA1609056.1 hypothetical protein [Acidobacteriota bacterium]